MSPITKSVKLYTDIPASSWVTINKRVSIVLASEWNSEYYRPIRVLAQYNALYAVSEKWKTTTFDQLIQFSQKIDFVAGQILSLLDTVCPAGTWKITSGQMAQVNTLINELKTNLGHLSQDANQLQTELNEFSREQLAADVAHGQEKLNPHWGALTQESNDAFTTAQVNWDSANQLLQTLFNKLPSIQSQIATAQSGTNQNNRLTIEVNLAAELMAERNSWHEVQRSARSFKSASSDQRQYMDSDNWYYQDVLIDENKFYQLGNRLSQTAGNLDYNPHTEYFPQQGQYMHLQLGPSGDYKTQYWKFIRRVNGWYQIVNGAGIALAYRQDKPYLDYYNDKNADQYWQCVHTDNGWFRLINLAGSNNHALGVMKENITHQIINVHKKKFLFITTSVSTETINWQHHRLDAVNMSTEANDPTQQWSLGFSTDSVDHLNNQGYFISQCTLQDNSGNKMNLAVTLEGDQIRATPLNNQSNQKWTLHSYTFYQNGNPYQLYAYVCQGKAIAFGGNNSALTAVHFDPFYQPRGNEYWLWTLQSVPGGWAKVLSPFLLNGEIWDIRGGCPHTPNTMIGTWNDNGGSGQHWRNIIT